MDYKEDKKNNICHPEFISGSYQHENNEEILWKTINFSQNNKMLKQVQHDMNVSLKKHIAFTHLVNPLRSDLSPAKQSQSPARSSLTGLRYSRPSGFTLAETLIALVVLGIVASITIPRVVRHHIEAANRAKIKKVMTVFDFLMNKLTTENNLKSNGAVEEWADANCQNTSNYFKVVKLSDTPKEGRDFCRFKTADGVWWDIENIMKPTVALKESELDNSDGKHTFKLLAHFGPNGELRVDDNNYEQLYGTKEDKECMTKLYRYVFNDNTINPVCRISYQTTSHSSKNYNIYEKVNDNISLEYTRCIDKTNKTSCTGLHVANTEQWVSSPVYNNPYANEVATVSYDKDNNILRIKFVNGYDIVENRVSSYLTREFRFDDNGKIALDIKCGSDTCSKSSSNSYIEYDSFGNPEKYYIAEKLTNIYKNNYDDEGKLISSSKCDKYGSNCSYSVNYEYDDNGSKKSKRECSGTSCSTINYINEYVCE